MFTVIGLMLGGMAIGFLLRRQEFSWINKVITSLIWVLLFLLGVEVGGNRQIVEGLCNFRSRSLYHYAGMRIGKLYLRLGTMVSPV